MKELSLIVIIVTLTLDLKNNFVPLLLPFTNILVYIPFYIHSSSSLKDQTNRSLLLRILYKFTIMFI